MDPKHSFIIPLHGKPLYLEELLENLSSETYPSDIILTSSEDNPEAEAIGKKFGVKYKRVEGGTIGKDWNAALSLAKTPLVTLAHQDDLYHERYTEEIISRHRREKAGIYFTDYAEIKDDRIDPTGINLKIKRLLLTPKKYFPGNFGDFLMLGFGCSICCPSVTYNRELLGDFSFSEDFESDLDWDLWRRLREKGVSFSYIPEILTFHRIHQESQTSRIIADRKREGEDLRVFSGFWPKPVAKLLSRIYTLSERNNG